MPASEEREGRGARSRRQPVSHMELIGRARGGPSEDGPALLMSTSIRGESVRAALTMDEAVSGSAMS